MDPDCQLDLTFAPGGAGRTILAARRIAYPYYAAAPVMARDGAAALVLQSVSGGLYGGERLSQRICVEAGAHARLIQPAATTVRRRAADACARQEIALTIAAGGRLDYLGRPLILLPGAALEQAIAVHLHSGGRLLLRDGFLGHRPAGAAEDNWRIATRIDVFTGEGRLAATERLAVTAAEIAAARPGLTGGYRAFGKLWLLGDWPQAEGLPARLQEDWPSDGPAFVAASALPGGTGLGISIAARTGGALNLALERLTAALGGPSASAAPGQGAQG